jgi:Outer membrane protein beta-barrel domain
MSLASRGFLGALLMAGLPLLAAAQRSRIGVRAGASFSNYVGSNTAAFTTRAGVQAGVLLRLPVSRSFGVQPEFLFTQKGAGNVGFRYGNQVLVGEQRTAYTEFAVLAKIGRRGGLFAEAGPQLGVLVKAVATVPNNSGQPTDLPNETNFVGREWGYVLGAGWQAQQGLLLGLRYNGGITDAWSTAANVQNSAFQVYAGFVFFGREEPVFPSN